MKTIEYCVVTQHGAVVAFCEPSPRGFFTATIFGTTAAATRRELTDKGFTSRQQSAAIKVLARRGALTK